MSIIEGETVALLLASEYRDQLDKQVKALMEVLEQLVNVGYDQDGYESQVYRNNAKIILMAVKAARKEASETEVFIPTCSRKNCPNQDMPLIYTENDGIWRCGKCDCQYDSALKRYI